MDELLSGISFKITQGEEEWKWEEIKWDWPGVEMKLDDKFMWSIRLFYFLKHLNFPIMKVFF